MKVIKKHTNQFDPTQAGPPLIQLLSTVQFEQVYRPEELHEIDEYYLKVGDWYLYMGLIAPWGGDWDHPNIHFVFGKTEDEVGEYLLSLYPEWGDEARIEIRKAKVHRPGIQSKISHKTFKLFELKRGKA
ncbi:hypothetical protein [Candidatus Magnetobacterium casense]|uniref:Uncharacterized protein n=1 Tax=Candidatus Magnetobacterium casense TaxID=1455061 RepID=A0ABS6RX66_9BACT|nr:hypothetical protein [Candidatus Magnetobacterium casensis]MBV6341211.1 hypothetical protein [Candidatus Magnetobacterium casensis]